MSRDGSWSGGASTPASAWGLAGDHEASAPLPERRYVDAGLLGEGGMGVVDAVYDVWLDREVARKRLVDHDERALALLVHEARVTARLEHPHIVPVHDAGVDAEGRWYFTMRLIRGRTLAEVLATRPAVPGPLPTLLRHLLEACRALAHAHAHGVVHGDLKPGNLLVGEQGETQVADWGLARFLDPSEPQPPLTGDAGTPPWRAPEVGADRPPDEASDVYALGLILREILSGNPERAPVDPPVELAAVMRRATAREPADRYADAGELAADLTRWLDGRPVHAHAYTPRELLARLLWAWRAPLAVAGVALLLGLAGLAWSNARTAAERDRAVLAEQELRATAGTLWASRSTAALRADDRPEAERTAREALALGEHPDARGVLAAFGVPAPAQRRAQALLPDCGGHVRLEARGVLCLDGAQVVYYDLDGHELARWPVPATDAAWLADGGLAVLSGERLLRLDPSTGATTTWLEGAAPRALVPGGAYVDRLRLTLLGASPHRVEPCPAEENLDTVAVDGEGTWWTVCSRGRVVRGGPDGEHEVLAEHPELRTVSALDVGRGTLLAGTLHGHLATLDPQTGALRASLDPGLDIVRVVRLSPDGTHAVAVDRAGRVLLWRAVDGALLGLLPVHAARDAWWVGPRELRVATDSLETWQLAEVPEPYRWEIGHGISALAVAPDHGTVALGLGPELQLRDLATGRLLHHTRPHQRTIKALAFDGDGQAVLSAAVDGEGAVVSTRVEDGRAVGLATGLSGIRRLVHLQEGPWLAAIYAAGAWRLASPSSVPERLELPRTWRDLVSPRRAPGAWALAEDGTLSYAAGQALPEVRGTSAAGLLAVSDDGAWLALGEGSALVLREAATQREVWRAEVGEELTALAFEVSGETVWTGTATGEVAAWSCADGSQRWRAPGHEDRVSGIVTLPEGRAVSAGWDGVVRRWEPPAFEG